MSKVRTETVSLSSTKNKIQVDLLWLFLANLFMRQKSSVSTDRLHLEKRLLVLRIVDIFAAVSRRSTVRVTVLGTPLFTTSVPRNKSIGMVVPVDSIDTCSALFQKHQTDVVAADC